MRFLHLSVLLAWDSKHSTENGLGVIGYDFSFLGFSYSLSIVFLQEKMRTVLVCEYFFFQLSRNNITRLDDIQPMKTKNRRGETYRFVLFDGICCVWCEMEKKALVTLEWWCSKSGLKKRKRERETIEKKEKCGRQWRENPLLALMSTVQIQQTAAKKEKWNTKKRTTTRPVWHTLFIFLTVPFELLEQNQEIDTLRNTRTKITEIKSQMDEKERVKNRKSSVSVRVAKSIARIENIKLCKHLGCMYLNRYFDIRKP